MYDCILFRKCEVHSRSLKRTFGERAEYLNPIDLCIIPGYSKINIIPLLRVPIRTASAQFGLPNSKLPSNIDPPFFFVYIPGEPERKPPQEVLDIKLHDLPSELDKPEGVGEMHEQVYTRGFAVAKHQIELM